MKSSDDLFQLIQSLDRNEKRYFRLFSSLQRGEKRYMQVFDAIERQKEYDEKKIIEMLGKDGFAKQFPDSKQYLYNLLLSSLKSYHSNTESQLYSHLHSIEILYKKGLYAQCIKLVTKTKLLAGKYGLQPLLLAMMKWEVKLLFHSGKTEATENDVEQMQNDMLAEIDIHRNFISYRFLCLRISIKRKEKGLVRNVSDLLEFQSMMQHPLLQSEQNALSPEALYHYYQCHVFDSFIRYDYENAYTNIQKQIRLLESFAQQIEDSAIKYMDVLNNLAVIQGFLKKFDEVPETIQKIKLLSQSNKIQSFYFINSLELDYCIDTGRFSEGLQLVKTIQKSVAEIKESERNKEQELLLHYECAYICFGAEDYKSANTHLNKILNEPINIRSDLQCFAKILSLFVHFEMGKADLLEYEVKSIHRFLYKRNRLYKVETIILDFIRKELPKTYSEKELLPALSILKEKIEVATKAPFERKILNYFDFVSWLESKIEGRAFAEVVREKTEKGL